jgi:hypothetical protein
MSAAGEQASAQSTSAENGFIVSNPFPFTETVSGNKDHSAFQFKPSMDHHAVSDSKINDITKEHPEHPAHPHSDNFKFADNDDYPGKASHDDSKINDIAKEQPEHPAHPHSYNFKFADDDGSAHPGHATGKDKDISATMFRSASRSKIAFFRIRPISIPLGRPDCDNCSRCNAQFAPSLIGSWPGARLGAAQTTSEAARADPSLPAELQIHSWL